MNRQEKIFNKFVMWNAFSFPFFVIILVSLILIESATYPGFIRGHLSFDLNTLFVLLIISGILASGTIKSVGLEDSWISYYKLLIQLAKLLLPALVVIGYIFISIESSNYPGFVYTKGFHFDPLYFIYLFVISGFLLYMDRVNFQNTNISPNLKKISAWDLLTYSKNGLIPLTVVTLLSWILFSNVLTALKDIAPRLTPIIKNPLMSRDDKMRHLHHDFYDYMQFVKQYTPEDAIILRMPQQGKWPSLSNDGYDRAFIYPRFTKGGDETNLNDPEIKYVFVHRAYGPPITDQYIEKWPTFKVPAKRVIYMRDNNYKNAPIVVEGDYDPVVRTYDDLWGIIELKR